MKVFVSYRRADGADAARSIKLGLRAQRAQYTVFLDFDDIPGARDFVEEIADRLADVDAVLALIGQHWASEEGLGRLEDADDMVRRELEAAIKRDVPIIPVLIHGATTPADRDLPEALRPAVRRNAVSIHDDLWDQSIEKLVRSLEGIKEQRSVAHPEPRSEVLDAQSDDSPMNSPTTRASSAAGPASTAAPSGDAPPDYILAQRAKTNGGSLDISVRELLAMFGRQKLTDTAIDELESKLHAAGLTCQPKVPRLTLNGLVRVAHDREVPEFHLRDRVTAEGPLSLSVADIAKLFGRKWLNDKARRQIDDALRYVGLTSQPVMSLAGKDGIVTVSRLPTTSSDR